MTDRMVWTQKQTSQCDRHPILEQGIGEIRGIVQATDAKVDALTERMDRLMLHMVPAASRGEIHVQTAGGSIGAAAPEQGAPWGRIIAVLIGLLVALTVIIEQAPAKIRPPQDPPAQAQPK